MQSTTKSLLIVALMHLAGCSITSTGEAYDLIDDDRYAEALPLLELAAEDGSKSAAVSASFLYLSNYQIPRNVDKARYYYELGKTLDYGRYDQVLDYFMPLAKAGLLLYDDTAENDLEATLILRGNRYSEFAPALEMLALTYAFGTSVETSFGIAKALFERAVNYSDEIYPAERYAWWLVAHPDSEFTDFALALSLLDIILGNESEADDAIVLNTVAAVYAANGRYEEAVRRQKAALAQLEKDIEEFPDVEEWRFGFECRLKFYQQGEFWRYPDNYVPFGEEGKEEEYCGAQG